MTTHTSTESKDEPEETASDASASSIRGIKVDLQKALWGGVLSAIVVLVGIWIVGRLSGAEARLLTETTLPRLHALCNTVILASATILALMLTLLSLSTNSNTRLKPGFYKRIQQLSLIDAIVFVAAMLVFLLLNIPIVEADKVPPSWFSTIYYVSITAASLLGGALVTIVVMLYSTVHDLISVVGLQVDNHAFMDTEQHDEESS